MKKYLLILFAAILIFSCQKEDSNVPIAGIKTSSAKLMVNVGETDTIETIVSPLNSTNRNVSWSSSNTAIVTVSSIGLVTGIAPGTAIVRVTTIDGNKTDSCLVSVIKWTTYNTDLANNYVSSLVIDETGNKWVGSWGGGVAKFDDIKWTTYNMANCNLSSDFIITIALDNLGNKWFGTFQDGVSKFDGETWSTFHT